MTSGRKGGGDIVRLSPFRVALERARRLGRVDALVERQDAAREVAQTPAEEIYWVVRDAGIADARTLVALCTADQVQRFWDLDVWHGDQIEPSRFWPWVDALLGAGWERAARVIWGVDQESLALLVLSAFDVIEVAENPDPPVSARTTPDGRFHLAFKGAPEDEPAAFKLVDALYLDDAERARRFLLHARSEVWSDLEETALQFQVARRAEMGFVPFDEAIAVYRKEKRNPGGTESRRSEEGEVATKRKVESRKSGGFPLVLVGPLSRDSAITGAFDEIDDPEAFGRLSAELAYLANAVISADRVEPADRDGTARSFERVRDWVSIGIEVRAAEHRDTFGAVLGRCGLRELFAIGHAEVADRVARAAALRARGPWTLETDKPLALLTSPWCDVLEQLAARRPDSVRSIGDLRAIDARLSEIDALARIRDALGLSRDFMLGIDLAHAEPSHRAAVTLPMLIRTVVANRATSGAASATPISADRIERLRSSPQLWAEAVHAMMPNDADFATWLCGDARDFLSRIPASAAVDLRAASSFFLVRA